MFTRVVSFTFRRENIKSMSRNSSKTSIKLTLAFYNLQHVEQRSQRVNPTQHRGRVSIHSFSSVLILLLLLPDYFSKLDFSHSLLQNQQ